ncbi:hypothetical protein GGF50DRAFT_120938 [Schizophyllum commune]
MASDERLAEALMQVRVDIADLGRALRAHPQLPAPVAVFAERLKASFILFGNLATFTCFSPAQDCERRQSEHEMDSPPSCSLLAELRHDIQHIRKAITEADRIAMQPKDGSAEQQVLHPPLEQSMDELLGGRRILQTVHKETSSLQDQDAALQANERALRELVNALETRVDALDEAHQTAIGSTQSYRSDRVASKTEASDLPRGLNTLRNTCYLNSLLQYLHTINDIREAARNAFIDDASASLNEKDIEGPDVKVDGASKSRQDIAQSVECVEFLRRLGSLFYQLQHDKAPSITPSIRLATLALASSHNANEIQRPMNDLERPSVKNVPSRNQGMVLGEQQDIMECLDLCISHIEAALLLYGKLLQRVVATTITPHVIGEKEGIFTYLPISDFGDGIDIYDGLDGYFVNTLQLDGKQSRMEVELLQVPPLLQIRLQRAQFDRQSQQPYKNQEYVKFGDVLYMDRYMHASNPDKKSRALRIQLQLLSLRTRLRQLRGDMVPAKSMSHRVPQGNAGERRRVEKTIVKLKNDLDILWREDRDFEYELTSVFIHSGVGPFWGHYYFYSRDMPSNPDIWFKYDDSQVSVVDRSEVFADTSGSEANACLLVYALKGSGVIRTVNRV